MMLNLHLHFQLLHRFLLLLNYLIGEQDFQLDFQFKPLIFQQQVLLLLCLGFKLSAIALNDVPLFQIFIDWIAIYDPRVAVLTYESSDLDQLANGQDDRKV